MSNNRHNGRRCIVAGCSNTAGNGVSVHTFPTDSKARNAWKRFVRLTRSDWQEPSKHSAICSEHFDPACFDKQFEIKAKLGYSTKRRLNPGSVPSIYPKRGRTSDSDLNEAFLASPVPPKKPRGAFEKRENARVVSQLMQCAESAVSESRDATYQVNDLENAERMAFTDLTKENSMQSSEGNTVSSSYMPPEKPRVQLVDKKTQVKVRTKEKGVGVDISPCVRSIAIQCDLIKPVISTENNGKQPLNQTSSCHSPCQSHVQMDITPSDTSSSSDGETSLYEPSSPNTSSDSDGEFRRASDHVPRGPIRERKYIVCESNLLDLFKVCRLCGDPSYGEIKQVVGTMVKIETVCSSCANSPIWYSQSFIGAIPVGNLALSGSILFSGAIPTKVLRVFNFMNLCHISKETFMLHQKNYLFPSISFCWNSYQSQYLQKAVQRGTPLVLGGDGRADTPGHSAKYGSYSLMDLTEGKIVDIELVQSNEVKGSTNMEKEGLIRSIKVLKDKGLSVGSIVTDRHLQIQKWIRENMPTTKHYYDVWHVAKGLKKKLCALSKEKECDEISKWIKSATNHLYWCAASTPSGDGDLMWAKWISLGGHIQNVHSGHGERFPRCTHGDLDTEVSRKKKWLKPGTKACEKMADIITSRQMKRDIPKLSPEFQTAEIEAYHSTINHFAPKMIGFSYHGMYCRLLLAAMHFNENSGRNQAVTKEGVPRYNIVYPKYKKGEYTVRETKVDQTFEYAWNLLDVVTQISEKIRMKDNTLRLPQCVPAPLCAAFIHPEKEDAVAAVTTRFSRKETFV